MDARLQQRLNQAIEDIKPHLRHVPPGMFPIADVGFRWAGPQSLSSITQIHDAQVRFVEFMEEIAAGLDETYDPALRPGRGQLSLDFTTPGQ